MQTENQSLVAHLLREQPTVEVRSAIADTFAGRIHVEWDTTAPVTPFGQLPFFIDYLKQAGLFDAWVADCPLSFSSPNAPKKRDPGGGHLNSATKSQSASAQDCNAYLMRYSFARPS